MDKQSTDLWSRGGGGARAQVSGTGGSQQMGAIKCYLCKGTGHKKWQCPRRDDQANLLREVSRLLARLDLSQRGPRGVQGPVAGPSASGRQRRQRPSQIRVVHADVEGGRQDGQDARLAGAGMVFVRGGRGGGSPTVAGYDMGEVLAGRLPVSPPGVVSGRTSPVAGGGDCIQRLVASGGSPVVGGGPRAAHTATPPLAAGGRAPTSPGYRPSTPGLTVPTYDPVSPPFTPGPVSPVYVPRVFPGVCASDRSSLFDEDEEQQALTERLLQLRMDSPESKRRCVETQTDTEMCDQAVMCGGQSRDVGVGPGPDGTATQTQTYWDTRIMQTDSVANTQTDYLADVVERERCLIAPQPLPRLSRKRARERVEVDRRLYAEVKREFLYAKPCPAIIPSVRRTAVEKQKKIAKVQTATQATKEVADVIAAVLAPSEEEERGRQFLKGSINSRLHKFGRMVRGDLGRTGWWVFGRTKRMPADEPAGKF